MSDIDFDELDRAVAAVLGSDGKKPDPQPQQAQSSADSAEVTPALSVAAPPSQSDQSVASPSVATAVPVNISTPVSAPVTSQPDQSSEVAAALSTPVAPPAQPVRISVPAQALHASEPVKPAPRGRFIDMVAPSPASRPAQQPAAVPTAAPVAASLQPVRTNGAFVSDIIAPQPVAKPAPAPVEDVTPKPVNPVVSEPADFFAGTPTHSPDASISVAAPGLPTTVESPAATEPANIASETADKTDLESAQSPFIPDAKVEKRPLGAFSASDTPVTLPTGDDLHKRLVQVESEESIAQTAEASVATPGAFGAPTVTAGGSTPAEKKTDIPKTIQKDVTPKPRAEKAPKHGKGTLIWVSVAIVVILIGVGVGASLYFFVIK